MSPFDESSDQNWAINHTNLNLAAGPDLLYSEHYKYAGYNLHWHLSLCFSSLLLHGKLPAQLMNILISPIIKDKKGKITKADNYRPIAKATPSSKVFEVLLLVKLTPFLDTSDNQFGF